MNRDYRNSKITVGEHIRFLRKKEGLTQKELAYNSSISLRYLQKIEKNHSPPNTRTLKDIAEELKTPRCYLISNFYNNQLDKLNLLCQRDILEKLPVIIYVTDLEGRIVYKNAVFETFFGKRSESEDIYLWHNPSSLEEGSYFHDKIMEIISVPRVSIEPIRTKKKTESGNILDVQLTLDYLRSSDQTNLGLVGVAHTSVLLSSKKEVNGQGYSA